MGWEECEPSLDLLWYNCSGGQMGQPCSKSYNCCSYNMQNLSFVIHCLSCCSLTIMAKNVVTVGQQSPAPAGEA